MSGTVYHLAAGFGCGLLPGIWYAATAYREALSLVAADLKETVGREAAHEVLRRASVTTPAEWDKEIVDTVLADQFPNAAEPNEWAMRNVAMASLRLSRSIGAAHQCGESG